jgi:hypothetical protein
MTRREHAACREVHSRALVLFPAHAVRTRARGARTAPSWVVVPVDLGAQDSGLGGLVARKASHRFSSGRNDVAPVPDRPVRTRSGTGTGTGTGTSRREGDRLQLAHRAAEEAPWSSITSVSTCTSSRWIFSCSRTKSSSGWRADGAASTVRPALGSARTSGFDRREHATSITRAARAPRLIEERMPPRPFFFLRAQCTSSTIRLVGESVTLATFPESRAS